MAKAFGLTGEQSRRIGKVVTAHERASPARSDATTGRGRAPVEFWAEITGSDPNDSDRYAWKLVAPDTTGDFTDVTPAVTGAGAFEANGQDVPDGTRVQLRLVGYDGGDPLYVFVVGGGGGETLVAQITSSIQSGIYNAKLVSSPNPSASGGLSVAHWGTVSGSNDCLVWDQSQTGASPARPLTGLIVRSSVLMIGQDSKPILTCCSAIQKLRVNSSTSKLQVSYLPSPSGDGDWVDAIDLGVCS